MDKNIKIIIFAIIAIIIVIICVNFKGKEIENDINITNTSVNYRINDNGEYTIYDSKTNEVIDNVKNQGELKLYQDNPNYGDLAPQILEENTDVENVIE